MKYFPTPWGNADQISFLNKEQTVIQVHTPGHGGIGVQVDVEMPKHLDVGMKEGQWRWYEEDLDWAIAALAFPDCFDEKSIQAAKDTVRNWHPKIYEQHYGVKLTSAQSHALRRQEIAQRMHNHYVVRAGWGDWAWDVPCGHVMAMGFRASDGDEITVLVPDGEYINLDELVLDNYPRFEPDRRLPYSKPLAKTRTSETGLTA